MGYQITRPDADQLKFTSSKTGDWVLEEYLQNAEYGNKTLANLLSLLFNTTTGAPEGDANSKGTSRFNNLVINGSLRMNAGSTVTFTGLSDPVLSSDAATKNYVDSSIARLVSSSSSTIGTLAEISSALANDPNLATTFIQIIGEKLRSSGGTMTGDIDMGTHRITGSATPVFDSDYVNMGYVSAIAGTLADNEASAALSKKWATQLVTEVVEGEGYSSKYHAQKSEANALLTAADKTQTAKDRASTSDSAATATQQAEISTDSAIKSTTKSEISATSASIAVLNAATAKSQAALSTVARVAAEVARDAAQLSAGVYAHTEDGLLGTAVGAYFSVPSLLDTEYLILYRHDAGGIATEIKRYPSVAGIEYAVANVVHIKSNGNDARDGASWKSAVRTIEHALALAWANPEPTLIEWAPEAVVYTNGHLDMPDNCVIKATHRTVFLRPNPGFEERNVFRMGSGCFLEGVMFEGWRLDSLTDPTEGFAVSFRPGAVIRRVPYAHKIAVRSIPTWGVIAPPLDRANANPEVPRGGGVILADGLVCSQYSTFPNIMAWGATPVTPNGIGYCAKNGGLINGVNAVSMWAHKHFQALNGGQIILSACSTQFGDYSLHAKGFRNLVIATEVTGLTVQTAAEAAILASEQDIIDMMWGALVFYGHTTGWTEALQAMTRADAATFLRCLRWTIKTANQQPMLDFAKGLFNTVGEPVFAAEKLASFVFSFNTMRDSIKALAGVSATAAAQVDTLVDALIQTVQTPTLRKEPSRITAIGHTWTAVMSGVALTKIPPARNGASISDSILEEDEGVVIASGQDDQGNALFVGGLQITADTGELGGPPFDQAVRRVATRAAISRSF